MLIWPGGSKKVKIPIIIRFQKIEIVTSLEPCWRMGVLEMGEKPKVGIPALLTNRPSVVEYLVSGLVSLPPAFSTASTRSLHHGVESSTRVWPEISDFKINYKKEKRGNEFPIIHIKSISKFYKWITIKIDMNSL